MSATRQKLSDLLKNLDANDRERLKAVGLSAFDEYVTSMPEWIKNMARSHVEKALENAIKDLLQ